MVMENVTTPSGFSCYNFPTTPTSIRSAPPSVRSNKSRKRSRMFREILNGNTGSYSAPTRSIKSPHRDTPLRVVSTKSGADVPQLENAEKYDKALGTYYQQNYSYVRFLGCGSYSRTVEVKRIARPEKHFAVKCTVSGDKRQLLDEIKKHESLLPHPNIVKFLIGWEEGESAFLLMELCFMGSLDGLLKPDKTILEEPVLWSYLIDILLGLAHLHGHKKVHCDIKPANIMLTEQNICKIGDFGLLFVYPQNGLPPFRDSNHDGDGKYTAPELLNSDVSLEADMFSLGVTLLELACSKNLPERQSFFCGPDLLPLPSYFEGMSEVIVDLIRSLMNQDLRERPVAIDILGRPNVRERMNDRQRAVLREHPPLPVVRSIKKRDKKDDDTAAQGSGKSVMPGKLEQNADTSEERSESSRMEEDGQRNADAGPSGVHDTLTGIVPELNTQFTNAGEESAEGSPMEEDEQEQANVSRSGVYDTLTGIVPDLNMGCLLS